MLKLTVLFLCVVGLYASAYMAKKAARAARGELTEASVVETPQARAIGGVPNALIGIAYYVAVSVALVAGTRTWLAAALIASLLAAAMSAYLGYSLLFITRRSCVYCWTAHAVNGALPVLLAITLRGA